MDTQIATAASMLSASPVKAPAPTRDVAKASAAAKEFESVFIGQFLGSMFSGIQPDDVTGGGQGEEMFRSMMTDQYAKSLEQRGGFGMASAIQAQILKGQGQMQNPGQAAS